MTPFYAISSNSHKVESMLDDIGIGTHRIRSVDDIVSSNQLWVEPFNKNEKELIFNYVDNAPGKIKSMFREIKQLII